MVPKGWDVKNLKDVTLKIQDGNYGAKYPKADELVDKGIPFLTSKALGGSGKTNPEKYDFITIEKHIELKKAHITTNDILFTNRGANVGVIGIAGEDLSDANIGPQLTLIRSNEKLVSYNYLYFFMKSSFFQRQVQGQDSGSAMNFFGIKSTEQFKIKVPPLSEQQKIAKILSTWDKAISTTERLIENSIQQKKALMQQLLTGKKRLLDDEGKRFEGEWEEKTLIDAGMTVTDGDRGKEYPNSSEFYDEGDYLFLSAKNVTKKGFLFEDTQFISKEKYEKLGKGIVNRGDVVLTTRGTVGQTAYYDDSVQYEFLRVNSGMVTLGCNNSELESNFFYALTNSSLFTRQVESLTFGSAQPQLTIKIIKSLKVPIPPVPEQQKIATVLINADKEIELLEQQLADLQQEKKALMQVLLTGKKRVKLND